MLESIAKHEELVKKFIAKVTKEYEEEVFKRKSVLPNIIENIVEDDTYLFYDLPIQLTILAYVKTNIIDNGEKLLNQFRAKYDTGEAVYFVNHEDLEILMSVDFMFRLHSRVFMAADNINALGFLYDLTIENFSNKLIGILDRVHYDELKGGMSNDTAGNAEVK